MCEALDVPVNDLPLALTCSYSLCPGAEESRMTTDDAGYRQQERGPAQNRNNSMHPSKTQNAQAEPGARPQRQSLAEKRAKAVYTAMERSARSCSTKHIPAQNCQCATSLGVAVSRLLPVPVIRVPEMCMPCSPTQQDSFDKDRIVCFSRLLEESLGDPNELRCAVTSLSGEEYLQASPTQLPFAA